MKKIKISKFVLIELTHGHYLKHACGGHNEFEPIGLQYIASVLINKGYDVDIFRQMSESIEELENTILIAKPDLVCFTVLTYNYNESLSLATKLKLSNKNLLTIFGGYHPSIDFENVIKNDCVDFIVMGEGEITIDELTDAIENDGDLNNVDGIVFKINGAFVRTPKRRRIKNLDSLAFPYRKIDYLKDCKIYGLMSPPASKQINTAIVSCSRGCPNDCEFCCSRTVWGNGVTYRSPQNIIQEIDDIQNKFNTNTFFFSDLTFNSSSKWVFEFCNQIIASGLSFNWYCMCTIRGINEELISIMSKAGCKKIGFGIESLDDDVSNTIKSFKHPSIMKMNEIFDLCALHGVFTKSYLMIGLPHEKIDILLNYKEDVYKLKVDEIKISFYTPFPGTYAFDKYKNQLIQNDFSCFDTLSHVIIKNENISEAEYLKIRKDILLGFYKRDDYKRMIHERVLNNPSLIEIYLECFKFLGLDESMLEIPFQIKTNC